MSHERLSCSGQSELERLNEQAASKAAQNSWAPTSRLGMRDISNLAVQMEKKYVYFLCSSLVKFAFFSFFILPALLIKKYF